MAQQLDIQFSEDIEVLVTPVLAQWATRVEVEANRFLLWKRFEVWADHRHRPT